jgi:rhodanese-related sulfurtransferase
MVKRTCITCDAKVVDKDKTPLWSKKDGLYSMLPRFLNCEDKYNPHKSELEEESPDIVGTELTVEVTVKETDNWLLFWAAEAGASLEGDKPAGAAKSYGSEENRGLTKIDSDGSTTFTLNCPKLYTEEDQLFPRHVHYTVLTEDKVWSTSIGTIEVTCKLSFETMEKIQNKRTYVIMNALSKESYDENHIPNSIVCHHESLEGLKKQKKTGIIKKLLNENLSEYSPVKEFVKEVDDIKQIPIIVYCANDECDASSKLMEHLYSCGFFNVMEYPGGMKEWLKKSTKTGKTKLFDDAASEDEDEEVFEEDPLEEGTLDGLNDDEEIIVYDGVEYIHKLDDSEEVLTSDDLTVVGIYDGEEIEWINLTEYEHHVKRIDGKGAVKKVKVVEDKEDVKEDEVEEDDVNESVEEGVEEGNDDDVLEMDEESSDEEGGTENYNKEFLHSKNVSELKKLLDKMQDRALKKPKKKKDMIDCLLSCKKVYTGGGDSDSIYYGGRVSKSMYENQFRGWGFTFLKQ